MTIRNVILGDRIPSSLHRLDEAQVEALKTYLAAGKPLLGLHWTFDRTPRRSDAR